MSRYSLLVSLHVASVIVWLGAGTTLVFVTIYARRARDGVVLDQLGTLVQWISTRVSAPAALAAFAFGVAAAHVGHWPDIFWFHVGEGALAFSFLLAVGLRLPLLRRARRGALSPPRLAQYLLALAIAELTVLYLAVADMVTKPSGIGASAVRDGGWVLAVGFLAAAATAFSARRTGSPAASTTSVGAPPGQSSGLVAFGPLDDQARSASTREVAERTAEHDEQPVLEPDQVEEMDEEPEHPGREAA